MTINFINYAVRLRMLLVTLLYETYNKNYGSIRNHRSKQSL